jgi:hypothetical protein
MVPRRPDRPGRGTDDERDEMSHEARGARPDVTVTVERLDVAAPRRGRRRRPVEGARVPRRDAVVLLAAAAVVVALLFAGAEARDAARKADANRRAVAAAKRASDFANVLALHERILAASRRTTRVYRAERGALQTASARARARLQRDRAARSGLIRRAPPWVAPKSLLSAMRMPPTARHGRQAEGPTVRLCSADGCETDRRLRWRG